MIAKALRQNARVIIMDEPSSPLEELEVRRLYEVIARLKAAGKAIIYVSHKMREIAESATASRCSRTAHGSPRSIAAKPAAANWCASWSGGN